MQINVLEYLENDCEKRSGDAVAIVDRGHSFAFSELEILAKRCAWLLIQRTDQINQPIAVFLPKCADAIFADLGIVYSGNIYTNLDVKSPAKRVQSTIENISPSLLITSRKLAPTVSALGVNEERIFLIDDIHDDIEYDSNAIRTRLDRVIDADPLCIINTSGSTGIPKGVVLNHRSTIDFMDWCFDRLDLDGGTRIGSLSPFHFDIFTLELTYCLAKGATIVIVPDEMAIFPAKLMEFVAEQAIGFIFWVPSIMVTISNQGLLNKFDLSALKTIFFAGEVFPMKHLNRWRESIPDARFVNLYGPIEITVDCTYFVLDRKFSDNEPLPIGHPCRNSDILILNSENEPCQVDEHGELCVRGSSLAMGYWNDPEKTATAFVQNPLNTRYPELIYRTGDIVYRNKCDEIMFVGRKDFQIKHMGYRIELSEIEHQVLCIDGIANACVVYYVESKEIALFYEAHNGELTPATIRRKLGEVFPKYMLPTVFHEMAELPRNSNGKIDRNRLQAIVQSEQT